jgi:DNA-binding CsgD family transcriptional regulator
MREQTPGGSQSLAHEADLVSRGKISKLLQRPMRTMLQAEYLSVLEVKTREELRIQLVRFAQQLGFETVAGTVVVDHLLAEPEFICVDNTPSAYRQRFVDRSYGKRDPVSQHCKTSSVPIIWDQSTYVAADRADYWEYQARFGYRYGISVALHLPDGKHFLLGVDRDQALPRCEVEITRMTAALQLFVVHAQEAAMRVLLPETHQEAEFPRLTPRELECLGWTMEGKTAWELGHILGIAEQTAVRHLHNASKKLQCVNKHQAVLKALRAKLIW